MFSDQVLCLKFEYLRDDKTEELRLIKIARKLYYKTNKHPIFKIFKSGGITLLMKFYEPYINVINQIIIFKLRIQ
jgi:hypothetical protein